MNLVKNTIILYNPKAFFFDMPLALLAIGSALDAKKYNVVIIDGRIEENPLQIISKHIDVAVFFGVTSLTGSPIKDALFITSEVKKLNHDLPIIWGGWHTSLFPKQTLHDEKNIDITVQVQGEQTFKELNQMHPKFSTPIFYFKPYPGSTITDEVIKKGYILPKIIYEWYDFDYIGSSGPWVSD